MSVDCLKTQKIRMLFHYVLKNGASVSFHWDFHWMDEKYWGVLMMVSFMFMIGNATKEL